MFGRYKIQNRESIAYAHQKLGQAFELQNTKTFIVLGSLSMRLMVWTEVWKVGDALLIDWLVILKKKWGSSRSYIRLPEEFVRRSAFLTGPECIGHPLKKSHHQAWIKIMSPPMMYK